jgi:hypothetical protein
MPSRVVDSRTATCGELLLALIDVALHAPYVRDDDRRWLAAMLHSFMAFEIEDYGTKRAQKVSELALGELEAAAYQWMDSLLGAKMPLASTLGTEALEFIETHYRGGRSHNGPWAFGALVVPEKWFTFHVIDKTLKKDITEMDVGQLIVRCSVPAGATVSSGFLEKKGANLKQFIFCCQRCHLSDQWGREEYGREEFWITRAHADYELRSLASFVMPGAIFDVAAGKPVYGALPPTWFTHWFAPGPKWKDWRETEEADWKPFPAWLVRRESGAVPSDATRAGEEPPSPG